MSSRGRRRPDRRRRLAGRLERRPPRPGPRRVRPARSSSRTTMPRQAGVHVLPDHQLADPGAGAPVHPAQLVADDVLAQRVEGDAAVRHPVDPAVQAAGQPGRYGGERVDPRVHPDRDASRRSGAPTPTSPSGSRRLTTSGPTGIDPPPGRRHRIAHRGVPAGPQPHQRHRDRPSGAAPVLGDQARAAAPARVAHRQHDPAGSPRMTRSGSAAGRPPAAAAKPRTPARATGATAAARRARPARGSRTGTRPAEQDDAGDQQPDTRGR